MEHTTARPDDDGTARSLRLEAVIEMCGLGLASPVSLDWLLDRIEDDEWGWTWL